jgi:hypothetical protein
MRLASWIGAAIGVVVMAVYALRPAAVLVDTAVVRRGELRVTVDDEGRIRGACSACRWIQATMCTPARR